MEKIFEFVKKVVSSNNLFACFVIVLLSILISELFKDISFFFFLLNHFSVFFLNLCIFAILYLLFLIIKMSIKHFRQKRDVKKATFSAVMICLDRYNIDECALLKRMIKENKYESYMIQYSNLYYNIIYNSSYILYVSPLNNIQGHYVVTITIKKEYRTMIRNNFYRTGKVNHFY